MAKEYLDQLSRMVDRATSGEIGNVKLACKHFFSGAAVYADGRICASLTPVGFAIKLPKASRDTLLKQKAAKPLKYFPNGPVKREYVVLPKALVNDLRSFRRWLEVSVDYVLDRPRS